MPKLYTGDQIEDALSCEADSSHLLPLEHDILAKPQQSDMNRHAKANMSLTWEPSHGLMLDRLHISDALRASLFSGTMYQQQTLPAPHLR